jgi:hypothetical protein
VIPAAIALMSMASRVLISPERLWPPSELVWRKPGCNSLVAGGIPEAWGRSRTGGYGKGDQGRVQGGTRRREMEYI